MTRRGGTFLDGLAARRLYAESGAGRVLDPLVDKVFVLVLLGVLVADGTMTPGWAVAVAARDLAVIGGVAATAAGSSPRRLRSLRARTLGKCATAAQFVLLAAVTLDGVAWTCLVVPTAALSAAAAVDYARAVGPGRRDEPTYGRSPGTPHVPRASAPARDNPGG